VRYYFKNKTRVDGSGTIVYIDKTIVYIDKTKVRRNKTRVSITGKDAHVIQTRVDITKIKENSGQMNMEGFQMVVRNTYSLPNPALE